MKMVVDGVAFQKPRRPAAASLPLWLDLINLLGAIEGVDLVVLDRGGMGCVAPGAIPFPPQVHADSASDSILVQRMCDHLGAELYLSTGFTTPLRTPSLLLRVADGSALDEEDAQEEAVALTFARIVCVPAAAVDAIAPAARARVAALPIPSATEDIDPTDLATRLHALARTLAVSDNQAEARFFERWESLRRLQAGVDIR